VLDEELHARCFPDLDSVLAAPDLPPAKRESSRALGDLDDASSLAAVPPSESHGAARSRIDLGIRPEPRRQLLGARDRAPDDVGRGVELDLSPNRWPYGSLDRRAHGLPPFATRGLR
jgi:hypothetical protein